MYFCAIPYSRFVGKFKFQLTETGIVKRHAVSYVWMEQDVRTIIHGITLFFRYSVDRFRQWSTFSSKEISLYALWITLKIIDADIIHSFTKFRIQHCLVAVPFRHRRPHTCLSSHNVAYEFWYHSVFSVFYSVLSFFTWNIKYACTKTRRNWPLSLNFVDVVTHTQTRSFQCARNDSRERVFIIHVLSQISPIVCLSTLSGQKTLTNTSIVHVPRPWRHTHTQPTVVGHRIAMAATACTLCEYLSKLCMNKCSFFAP